MTLTATSAATSTGSPRTGTIPILGRVGAIVTPPFGTR